MGFVTYVLVTGVVLGTQQRLVYTCSMSYFSLPHSHPTCAHTHTHQIHSRTPWSHSQLPSGLALCRGAGHLAVSLPPCCGLTAQVAGHHCFLRIQVHQVNLSPPPLSTLRPSPPSSDTSRVASCITVRMVEPHPYQKFRDATNRTHTSHSSKVLCSHNTPLPS